MLYRKRHRFPNLASMKLSNYYKQQGNEVELITNPQRISGTDYNKIIISKVFTDTPIEQHILESPNVEYGGTGFFYDKAPPLPQKIESIVPDYTLYDEWVKQRIKIGDSKQSLRYYTDYSIGFLTRGCFRKCEFCVNRNYDKAFISSTVESINQSDKKKICLLDDNFLSHPQWKEMLLELQGTGKPFQFKQGLDERLLTDDKCELIFSSKYDGDYIFAFDDVKDYKLIQNKLKLIRKYNRNSVLKFYTLCAFDRCDNWDKDFWANDIESIFIRTQLLMHYRAMPYIMRYAKYQESPFRGMYISIANWCNTPSLFKKWSFREFCYTKALRIKNPSQSSDVRYIEDFERQYPIIAKNWFDMKYESESNYYNKSLSA